MLASAFGQGVGEGVGAGAEPQKELAAQEGDVVFAGRLGGYKYYDMDKAIAAAFELVRNKLGVEPTEA
mgnify:CR=1 FL=1